MGKPHYWDEATDHLRAKDARLGAVIAQFEGEHIGHTGDGFVTLCNAIVGQQISVKAADAIWARLEALCGGISPEQLLAQPPEALRGAGISAGKARYLRGIAEAVAAGRIDLHALRGATHAEAQAALVTLPGVGPWTAEMFMIFHLHLPDVLPLGDVGVLKAIRSLYGEGCRPGTPAFERLAKRWTPYRSVASWYLWRSLDPKPIQY